METERLHAETLAAAAASIDRAAAIIRRGGLVAFPTETVYGLGGDATNPLAVARIFEAKGRPTFDPLIVHVADRADLVRVFTTEALRDPRLTALADALWPGPLTIVAASLAEIPGLVRAGLPNVGVRIPRHETARALIRAAGVPIAAPSANRFGLLSPTRADHVLNQLDGLIDALLLGEATEVGVESSVVALAPDTPAVLLRPGGVPLEQLRALLAPYGGVEHADRRAPAPSGAALPAPGMTAAHYAPRTPLYVVVPGEVALLRTKLPHLQRVAVVGPDDAATKALAEAARAAGLTIAQSVALSPTLDHARAASRLFDLLHSIDGALGGERSAGILVAPYPSDGLGLAIADRLHRAAAAQHERDA
jgi:L-threonylcarbamoyladenylate synthase